MIFIKNTEIFMIYIADLEVIKMSIHPVQKGQTSLLQTNKTSTKVFLEYLDYANIFFSV